MSEYWGIQKLNEPWTRISVSGWTEQDAIDAAEYNSNRWGPHEVVRPDTPDVDGLLSIARNIVNQLGDLWAERIISNNWVKVRQETNDEADQFVLKLLREARKV